MHSSFVRQVIARERVTLSFWFFITGQVLSSYLLFTLVMTCPVDENHKKESAYAFRGPVNSGYGPAAARALRFLISTVIDCSASISGCALPQGLRNGKSLPFFIFFRILSGHISFLVTWPYKWLLFTRSVGQVQENVRITDSLLSLFLLFYYPNSRIY